jgi:hypothetical protein
MKKELIFLIIVIIMIISVWGLLFNFEDPVTMQRAMRAIDLGRDYEILIEETKYITSDDSYTDLLFFLEGHHGYIYEFEKDGVVTFNKNGHKIEFELKKILFKYVIWVRR